MTPVGRGPRKLSGAVTPHVDVEPRRFLLDTHVWLWWQADDARLGERTRQLLQRASEVRFSVVSAWEIAIKVGIGKLTLPVAANIAAELARCGFLALPVELAHAEDVRNLPALHSDPFDRMLVAQSRVEGLTLLTADRQLSAYGVTVMDARV